MFRWMIIGGVAAAAVAAIATAGCLMHNATDSETTPTRPGSDDKKNPFAVKWTDAPLAKLSAASIKVCKSTGVLTVFEKGEAVKSYHVITGENSGDKEKEGDKRTPEGVFHVVYRNPKSKYVLSLGLDYPNREDADRGLRAGLITKKQHDAIVTAVTRGQQPPWKTALGGEIMIHGAKGNRTGTLGCVSMDDNAIRELYPKIGLGVNVQILP